MNLSNKIRSLFSDEEKFISIIIPWLIAIQKRILYCSGENGFAEINDKLNKQSIDNLVESLIDLESGSVKTRTAIGMLDFLYALYLSGEIKILKTSTFHFFRAGNPVSNTKDDTVVFDINGIPYFMRDVITAFPEKFNGEYNGEKTVPFIMLALPSERRSLGLVT